MKEKKNIFNILVSISIVTFILVFVSSCEDAPPSDYIPQKYVEAYLTVGEPIRGIKLYTTQPTTSPYKASEALVRDAKVQIISANDTFNLVFRDSSDIGYFYPDTNYKVKPKTNYHLKITLNNGKIITGDDVTPSEINWVKLPKDYYYFPKDSLNPPEGSDSLIISWTKEPTTPLYIISVLCLDSLDYGKYLTPPSTETNRRCYNIFYRENEEPYREMSSMNMIFNTQTPVVWMAFKWFGKQRISIFAPSQNYSKWFLNAMFSQNHDPNMNSVNNAIGVFGSVSVARKESFLIKNQP